MLISVIGTGYVGLITGVCLAKVGNSVCCYDKQESIIKSLRNKKATIYEDMLDENLFQLVGQNLSFSSDINDEFLQQSDVIFVAVGTPMSDDGSANLSYLFDSVKSLAQIIKPEAILVIKSTVPVGTCDQVEKLLHNIGRQDVSVVSNPEFLREGSAINDFMYPDRIVVGIENNKPQKTLEKLYSPFIGESCSLLVVNRKTSELIKYASNAFLSTKIAFINQISDYCEKIGADIEGVAKGMGLDPRVGSLFLKPGPGYGGSCFPKDTAALAYLGQQASTPLTIIESVIKANDLRKKESLLIKLKNHYTENLKDKKVAILGLTFKENTDDVRYSPAIDFVRCLLSEGALVQAHDPMGIQNFKQLFPEVKYNNDVNKVFDMADIVCLLTPWPEYKKINFRGVQKEHKGKIFIDYRNYLTEDHVNQAGFKYIGIGKQYD